MPVYAPSTSELRAELAAQVAALVEVIERITAQIVESERALSDLADHDGTCAADKVKALGRVNASLHARADAARKELAEARRLLRVVLPRPLDEEQFAAAVAAGEAPGVSDELRLRQFSGRPGLPDADGDATLRPLTTEQLDAMRRAWREGRE